MKRWPTASSSNVELLQSISTLSSLRCHEGRTWSISLVLALENVSKARQVGLRSLELSLSWKDVAAHVNRPYLWEFIDLTSLMKLSFSGHAIVLDDYLKKDFLDHLMAVIDLRTNVTVCDSNDTDKVRQIHGHIISFLSSKGDQIRTFHLQFKNKAEFHDEFPLDPGFLRLISNIETLSLTPTSGLRQPFPRLPLFRTLYLGLFDNYPEDEEMPVPKLPDWCSDPSRL